MRQVVRGDGPGSVYVGRPTFLGNPFRIGEDGTREEVIERYRVWFLNRIETEPGFAGRVRAHCEDLDLACWCAPLACHADVIRDWLDGDVHR